VDAYEVLYSANSFPPRIALKNAGNYIGQMIFCQRRGSARRYRREQAGAVALPPGRLPERHRPLRYEKPIYMFYNGSGGGFENGIRTMSEKVGEGEGSP
jgi:hypothetical protein